MCRPESLETEILVSSKKIKWVVLDEVQKVPRLLDTVLIEIKASAEVTADAVRHLVSYRHDFPNPTCYLLSTDPRSKIIDGINCMPWNQGLKEIFMGKVK
jgi:hypothetical protein